NEEQGRDPVWICPSAPEVKDPNARVNPGAGFEGTIASAWVHSNWFNNDVGHLGIPPSKRVSSYALNAHLIVPSLITGYSYPQMMMQQEDFVSENQVVRSVLTPVLGDGSWWWPRPHATDPPPTDLYGALPDGTMRDFAMPRHGNRPRPVPRDWPRNQRLPGAVNLTFFDGHSELVKLDNLWQLYW